MFESIPNGLDLDARIRLRVFEQLLEGRAAPTADEMAADLAITGDEAAAAYRRLAQQHRLVLRWGTTEILMANPLSPVPTAFSVEVGGRSYFGNCIWDALGVIAMLGDSGRVATTCGDGCGQSMTVAISGGTVTDPRGIIHFQVPRARWWDDIVFT